MLVLKHVLWNVLTLQFINVTQEGAVDHHQET